MASGNQFVISPGNQFCGQTITPQVAVLQTQGISETDPFPLTSLPSCSLSLARALIGGLNPEEPRLRSLLTPY